MTTAPLRNLIAVLAALPALAGGAQAPSAPWRTLATRHYLIHYPDVLADWAQDVAVRIEGIHRAVVDQVGYASPETVQVVLADPMAEPNGMAVPLLAHPYVILWRTEPRSDDPHGNALASWTAELVSHELTHIHHLTRPNRPRTPFGNLFLLPVGPLALKCPRWVTEGYATLCEGRITGSGRPHSAFRAAVIRQWALAGKLPPYEALNGTGGYLGGGMAYLVGSAYLEWLERSRPGDPDAMKRFWRQLASRRNRPFDEAFAATFGFTARDGYQRFQAEAAHDALEWEQALKARGLREGERVLRTDGTLRTLQVSPDGKRLLGSLDDGLHPGLKVWDLARPRPEPPRTRPDPFNPAEDVAPEWPGLPEEAALPSLDHRLPRFGEWVDDATIRFRMKRADAEGVLRPRPALWRLERGSGRVERDPRRVPPPAWKALEPVLRDGAWVLELDGKPLPLPGQAMGRAVFDPARAAVYAACEVDGFWNLVAVPVLGKEGAPGFGEPRVLTRTLAGAWNPAPTPDGRYLYYTSLDPLGMAIRRLDLAQGPLDAPEGPAPRILSPRTVTPPARERVDLPREAGPLPSHPYRATEDPWVEVAGTFSFTPSGQSYATGVSGSDFLGRLSWQVLAGFGNGAGPRGAAAGVSSSAWRWSPAFSVFDVLERPSSQAFLPAREDRERRGAELAFRYENRGELPFWLAPVAAFERAAPREGAPFAPADRSLLGLRGGLRALWSRDGWGLEAAPAFQAYQGSTTAAGTQDWTLLRAGLGLRVETPAEPLGLSVAAGRIAARGNAGYPEAFHLGGVTTSLVPESLDCLRVAQPALPAYLATGDRFLRWRGQAGGALHAYLEGLAVWDGSAGRGPFQRVAGLEYALDGSLGAAAPASMRALRLELGVHRGFDGVMRHRTVATATLVVRP